MRWSKQDILKYVQAEEYIDTVFLPLVPFSFHQSNEKLSTQAFQKEMIEMISGRVEHEFAGRVFLLPTYTYLQANDEEVRRLNSFTEEIKRKPFKFIFYLTFDSNWKKSERNLEENLIWVPVLKDGDIHNQETQKLIMDQVQQITELIRNYWTE